MDYYQRKSQINLGEKDKLEIDRPEGLCSNPLCHNLAMEDEELCPECLGEKAEYDADMREDR